ncbi:MAG: hypothetical protein KGS48_02355 [Bacteroidetes bacterium]|nr:hypothetical protein [Bacteroidota bacterium]
MQKIKYNNPQIGIILLSCILLWAQCGSGSDKFIPDVSHIQVETPIRRFDQDLFALDTTNLAEGLKQLEQKYPEMLPLFTQNLIHDQTNPLETPLQAITGFLKAPQIRHLYDSVQIRFAKLDALEPQIHRVFQFYKYYFPGKPIPEIDAFLAEFSTDVFTAGDSLCGIGLDMFLGAGFSGYNPEIFPAYLRRQFVPEYIPVRLAKVLAQNVMPPPPAERRLLDLMLYQGKLLYLTDCLTPEAPDSMKMGYTRAQLEGCFANEKEVWARLLDQNLLYSTDYNKIRKLVEPSPNAPVVFQEAPGEIGNWVGWQIVRAYMKRNPDAKLADMLAFTDAQKFLEAAKYKPKRL